MDLQKEKIQQRWTMMEQTVTKIAEEEDAEMDEEIPSGTLTVADCVAEMVEFLKAEHLASLERGDLWDLNVVQNVIFNFLEEIRASAGQDLRARCSAKIATLFSEMQLKAIEQSQWESADRYQAITGAYEL
eukprot:s1348_g17.t1